MKFKGPDGKIYSRDISLFKWQGGELASVGEYLLGKQLKKLFPNLTIYVQLPCAGTRLRLDFYINELKLAFEFDGEQHEKYVPHFHGTKRKFQRSLERDLEKEVWCRNNQIRLIRVKTTEIGCLEELIRDRPNLPRSS